ncbi:hypothetical protein OPW39_15725 [Vibrio europaeus]|uniref:hypothetical protein n=1 Tax=Vibrio europaeus TaxID=300876 RepID=UPI00233ED4E0|nr:hypothetical protein [Vibrio europaeus]MDC5870257.1 hypothetical protein [Vibrio europaeus]
MIKKEYSKGVLHHESEYELVKELPDGIDWDLSNPVVLKELIDLGCVKRNSK